MSRLALVAALLLAAGCDDASLTLCSDCVRRCAPLDVATCIPRATMTGNPRPVSCECIPKAKVCP